MADKQEKMLTFLVPNVQMSLFSCFLSNRNISEEDTPLVTRRVEFWSLECYWCECKLTFAWEKICTMYENILHPELSS